jgi:hypothetical protein
MEMHTDYAGRPCFDLALTMAGAVSAGAYTAGVIDFLIQALDAWEDGKQRKDPMAPQHAVNLRAISGASAGSITAAILGACLKYDFPHRRMADAGDGSENPLYDSWVNMIDISHLLQIRDLQDGRPVSLLDSTRLLDVARKSVNYGEGVNPKARPYLSDPLRFIFTVTNLRGVPFMVKLGGSEYHHPMTMHGDSMRFALQGLGRTTAPTIRLNEYPLTYPNSAEKWGDIWEKFAMAALASGAFPLGLSPRELIRRTSDYRDMPIVVPGGPGEAAEVRRINPIWSDGINSAPGTDYRFVNVDGGTIDNEPLELARIELAGGDPLARNRREGLNADRAVIMIDPFVGPDEAGPETMKEVGLIDNLLYTFAALKNQARFRPQDVALALDDTIYSRFLIAPVRDDKRSANSGTSIACGSLSGFGGFMHIRYRQHDFFLGRRNCQRFLSQHLTLPENHPLFTGKWDTFQTWTADQKKRYAVQKKRRDGSTTVEFPIIPLMPGLNPEFDSRDEEREPTWPRGVFDPASLDKPIKKRLDGLFNALARESRLDQKLLGCLFGLGWSFYAKPKIARMAIHTISKKLKTHKLL